LAKSQYLWAWREPELPSILATATFRVPVFDSVADYSVSVSSMLLGGRIATSIRLLFAIQACRGRHPLSLLNGPSLETLQSNIRPHLN
jgi:hypothetical protein